MQVENCLVSVSKCSWIYGKRKGRGDEEGRNGRKRGDREEETDGWDVKRKSRNRKRERKGGGKGRRKEQRGKAGRKKDRQKSAPMLMNYLNSLNTAVSATNHMFWLTGQYSKYTVTYISHFILFADLNPLISTWNMHNKETEVLAAVHVTPERTERNSDSFMALKRCNAWRSSNVISVSDISRTLFNTLRSLARIYNFITACTLLAYRMAVALWRRRQIPIERRLLSTGH